MRYLAIDPGEKHIGVAVCDELGFVARPLTTLAHEARAKDAERLVALAVEHQVGGILVGHALNADGQAGAQAKHAERLAEALQALTTLPVFLHDESYSTQTAQAAMRASGKKRQARREQIHAVAAAAILQSYLDAHAPSDYPPETPPD